MKTSTKDNLKGSFHEVKGTIKGKRQRKYTVEEFRGSARKGDFSEKEQANALD